MRKISRPKELSVMIVIAVLLIAAAIVSLCISYVVSMGSVDPDINTEFDRETNIPDKISYIKTDAYTTPYGTFEPIEHVLDINEYMTLHPNIIGSEACILYITESGDTDRAREIMKEVKRQADNICKGISNKYDKVYALAMWTGKNMAYDFDAAEDEGSDLSVTSLEAIIENGYKTTCAGFSNMFSALCYTQGIYCLNMKGGTSSEGWTRAQLAEAPANHEWNAVVIDGEWYYTDCTWITDYSYQDGEYYGGSDVKPFYAVFGFGEMSIEHRIDRCEYRVYRVPANAEE